MIANHRHHRRPVQWHEPTLAETLSDPIVQAVMQADRVDRRKLEAVLRFITERIESGPR